MREVSSFYIPPVCPGIRSLNRIKNGDPLKFNIAYLMPYGIQRQPQQRE